MNFTASFLALLAAAQTVVAFPFGASDSPKSLAPVPVTKLTCDGAAGSCTANLDFAGGNWVATWGADVFHTSLKFGVPDHKKAIQRMVMAPVPVTDLNCDGDTNQCTANLDFADGAWVAQWSANIFHSFTGAETSTAPVPVTQINCDGDIGQCTGNLKFGHGGYVAQWGSSIFPTTQVLKASFLKQ